MDLINQLKALDQIVIEGKLVEAVQSFFHPDFHYLDPSSGKRLGKVSKVAYTWEFERQIKQVNAVVLNESLVGDQVTMSEFLFDFTQTSGELMQVHEIIKREWKDGLVLREWYFVSEGFPNQKLSQAPSNILTLEKAVNERIPLGSEGLKSEIVCLQKGGIDGLQICIDIKHINSDDLEVTLTAPLGEVFHLHKRQDNQTDQGLQRIYNLDDLPGLKDKSILGTWALEVRDHSNTESGTLDWWCLEFHYHSLDDLTKIEGIGPKIASILMSNGIDTFGKLAASKSEVIKEILHNEGPRYKMHDPSSWPEQAALAAGNEWEKLGELQDQLKGGK